MQNALQKNYPHVGLYLTRNKGVANNKEEDVTDM